jgi:hypothetical protein
MVLGHLAGDCYVYDFDMYELFADGIEVDEGIHDALILRLTKR